MSAIKINFNCYKVSIDENDDKTRENSAIFLQILKKQ